MTTTEELRELLNRIKRHVRASKMPEADKEYLTELTELSLQQVNKLEEND